jgi:hypothetical protein
MTREHGAGDVHRPEQVGFELRPEVFGGDLLEEPGVEVPGVVDEDVDAAEPVERRPHASIRVRRIGDVELDGEEIVVPADCGGDLARIAPGGDDVVTGGERGASDVDAHTAAGAGDEPHLLVSRGCVHVVVLSSSVDRKW